MLIRRCDVDDDGKSKKKKKKRQFGEAGDFTYTAELPPDQHPSPHTTDRYFSIVGYRDHSRL